MANARDVKDDIEIGEGATIKLWFRAELRTTTELKISVSVRGKEENVPAISSWEGDDVKTCALDIDIPKANCTFARAFAEDGTVAVEVTWMKVIEQEGENDGDGGQIGDETEPKGPEEQKAYAVLHLQKLLVSPRELSSKLVGDGFTITFGTNSDILSNDVRAFLIPCALDAECKSLPPRNDTTSANISAIESITFPGGPTCDYRGHPIILFTGTWNNATLRSNVQTHRCTVRTYHGEAAFLLSDLLRIKKWSDKQDIVPKLPAVNQMSTSWDIEKLFADTKGHVRGTQQAAHTYVENYLEKQSKMRLSVECYCSLERPDTGEEGEADTTDSEPFGRIVVIFTGTGKKLVFAAKKLVGHVLRCNTVIMKMENGPSRAIATRQMTQHEKEDCTLNVFTGFCLHCDNVGARIICIEGIKNSDVFKELRRFAQELSATKGHNGRVKVLQHEKVGFDKRLYGDFDLVIKQIKLREKLDDISHRPDLFDPRKTDPELSRGLQKVMEMKQADRLATLKMNQSFPLARDLVAIDTLLGDFITDAELFGNIDNLGASMSKSQKGSTRTNGRIRSPERGNRGRYAQSTSTNTSDRGHSRRAQSSLRGSSSRASGRVESRCIRNAPSSTPSDTESKRTASTALRALQLSRAETTSVSKFEGSEDLSPSSVRFMKRPADSPSSSLTLEPVTAGLHIPRITDCHNSTFDRRLDLRAACAPVNRIRANKERVHQLSARTAASTARTHVDTTFLPPDEEIHIYSTQTRNTVARQLSYLRSTLDAKRLYACIDGTTFCPVDLTKQNNYFLRQEDVTLRRTDAPEFHYPRAKERSEFTKQSKDVSAARKEELKDPWVEDKDTHAKEKPIRGRFDSRTLALTTPRVAEVPPRNVNSTLTQLKEIAVEEKKKWQSKVVVKKTTMSFPKHGGARDAILQDAPAKLGVRFTARAEGEVHNVEPHLKPLSSKTPFTDYRLNSSLVTPYARIVMKPSTKRNVIVNATPREKRLITALNDEDRQRFPHTARF
eukprot:GEMP01008676.1.p1 GENE.GEMP01008676.1~~GEMP01008676.1.p1  ORF type:complete len:1009 (+),score=233.20 GEMP01008676.1:153-3179(+)